MQRLTGVGTPASRPSRATAPFSQSISSGLPCSRSYRVDEVMSAGMLSNRTIGSSTSAGASRTPRAAASAMVSRAHASRTARPSGSSRIGPIGERASAVMPLWAQRKVNLVQIAAATSSARTTSIPAFAQASRNASARAVARPSRSPNSMRAVRMPWRMRPGASISARM